jgi:hypothetical protein
MNRPREVMERNNIFQNGSEIKTIGKCVCRKAEKVVHDASGDVCRTVIYSGTSTYEFNSFCNLARMSNCSYLKAIFPI